MNKFFNKIKSADGIGIILLAILVVVAGYMVYFQKDFKVTTSTKSNSNHQDLAGYYFDDYYDDYYDEDYYYDDEDYYYDDDYYYEDDYYYDDDYYYEDDYYYDDEYIRYLGNNYHNYNDYYNENDYYDYDDTKAPAIKYKTSRILKQYSVYDPMDEVSAHHSRFGDVTDIIEIVYNDVDTDVPGVYTTVYKACNYPGSIYCVTVSTDVTVRDEYFDLYDKSNRGPIWSNTDSVSCTENSTKCSTYNIEEPTAKDPVTDRKLNVTLIEGSVNIYEPGTYVLVYSAETRSGVVGTTSKIVKINESHISSSNSSSSNKATRKYISNYKSDYYDDGYYRGYLEEDYSNGYGSKYIDNYEWTNKVTYTYKCTKVGEYGTAGWSLVSTDKSNGQYSGNADNHPTYYYNKNGYAGTLTKSNFYLKDSETKLAQDLGKCTTNGQTKQVTRTWVGEYSGTVYSNYNYKTTYSGYVYLYR